VPRDPLLDDLPLAFGVEVDDFAMYDFTSRRRSAAAMSLAHAAQARALASAARALWGFDVGAGLNGGQDGSTTKPWYVRAGQSRRM